MKILTIENIDLILSVYSNDVDKAFYKAQKKQGPEIATATTYTISDGLSRIVIYHPTSSTLIPISSNAKAHPIFFENKDYNFDIQFKCPVKNSRIFNRSKEVTDKFYKPTDDRIAGALNYRNDIGKTDFIVRYNIDDNFRDLVFSFEVFPTKLDYRKDFKSIIQDIEQEYPLLVLDFLRKTYLNFRSGSTNTTDLIWWQIFGGLYNEIIDACKHILSKPHSRLVEEICHVKRERIKVLTPQLAEDVIRHKHLANRYYEIRNKTLSPDTTENQFLKYAIRQILRKYHRIRIYIVQNFKISPEFNSELEQIERTLVQISNHPLFRGVSEYRGMRQESLVLQKATGYSTIYRSWIILNHGMTFLEGIQKIELKNIADLYQIWCFLEMKKIIQSILGKDKPDDVKLATIEADGFVFKFASGRKSEISFVKNNGDVIYLYHDYQFYSTGSHEVKSHTVDQRPDIVLRVTKNDLRDAYGFTYLYDAKYRLQSDLSDDAPDYPPDDAINQMHRYRDAIYYQNKEVNKPEKEIIGGYILFPGKGEHADIKNSYYQKSIPQVNIGAYPLAPNDLYNRSLLEEHLKTILEIDSENILREVIPQKLLRYEIVNPEVLIGIVSNDEHIKYFYDNPESYHTGSARPKRFGYSNLKYFCPYIKGIGARDYYEIVGYEIVERNKIYPKNHPLFKSHDSSERLVLRLGKKFTVKTGAYFTFQISTYRYSTLSSLYLSEIK